MYRRWLAHAYEARGREFESLRAYHIFNDLAGAIGLGEYHFVPLQPFNNFFSVFGWLSAWLERRLACRYSSSS